MCVRVHAYACVSVSDREICVSKTQVDAVMGAVLLVGAGPSFGLGREAATEHSLPYLLSADY